MPTEKDDCELKKSVLNIFSTTSDKINYAQCQTEKTLKTYVHDQLKTLDDLQKMFETQDLSNDNNMYCYSTSINNSGSHVATCYNQVQIEKERVTKDDDILKYCSSFVSDNYYCAENPIYRLTAFVLNECKN